MNIVFWNSLDDTARQKLLQRPSMESTAELRGSVAQIIAEVRRRGDQAILDFGARFDGRLPRTLLAEPSELSHAAGELEEDLLDAIEQAMHTVSLFHEAGKPQDYSVETAPGVTCQARYLPLDPVGLYVPAGSAPLPSTAIMLAVPARLAGCQNIILATPPSEDGRAHAAVRAIAHRLNISTVLVAGGAQAVAAMAFGTESVPACAKIFGPGNRFVTEAKRQVAETADGAAMDLPAGPSELMVIAGEGARADFVAMDLLSQAEHGADSQVFLVTTRGDFATAVAAALEEHLTTLPRANMARQSLAHGAMLVVDNLASSIAIANTYAPEHLIIASDQAQVICDDIQNAGSVFLGHYTPESLGDYISGTNHVLPTGGWARSLAGLSTTDFMRRMTVQEASADGLKNLGSAGARLAAYEGLEAHRRAITLRLQQLESEL